MSAEVLWLLAAAVFAVGEMATLVLFLGLFAVGALVAGGVAFVGGGVVAQAAAFVGTSALLVVALRPIARRHRRSTPELATGVEALLGERGTVVEPVDGENGRVKIKGEVWSARAFPEGDVIPAGMQVRVLRIDGAIAVVTGSDF